MLISLVLVQIEVMNWFLMSYFTWQVSRKTILEQYNGNAETSTSAETWATMELWDKAIYCGRDHKWTCPPDQEQFPQPIIILTSRTSTGKSVFMLLYLSVYHRIFNIFKKSHLQIPVMPKKWNCLNKKKLQLFADSKTTGDQNSVRTIASATLKPLQFECYRYGM